MQVAVGTADVDDAARDDGRGDNRPDDRADPCALSPQGDGGRAMASVRRVMQDLRPLGVAQSNLLFQGQRASGGPRIGLLLA